MRNVPIIFHVGLPKCASTTLQYALCNVSNTTNYVNCGLVSKADNQMPLDLFFKDPEKFKNQYVCNQRPNVFSSEAFLGSPYKNFDLRMKFIGILNEHFKNTRILIGIRNPAGYLVSLYNQVASKGYNLPFPEFCKNGLYSEKIEFDHLSLLMTIKAESNADVFDFPVELLGTANNIAEEISRVLTIDNFQLQKAGSSRNKSYSEEMLMARFILNQIISHRVVKNECEPFPDLKLDLNYFEKIQRYYSVWLSKIIPRNGGENPKLTAYANLITQDISRKYSNYLDTKYSVFGIDNS